MTWQCVMYERLGWRDNPDGNGRTTYYRGPDGEEYTFKTLPIGAIFVNDDCQRDDCARPDGTCVVVKVPSRDGRGTLWPIDHPGSDNAHWSRTGTIPNITASPSINYVGEWHGWLRNGELSDA